MSAAEDFAKELARQTGRRIVIFSCDGATMPSTKIPTTADEFATDYENFKNWLGDMTVIEPPSKGE